jgi:hypothetical protein
MRQFQIFHYNLLLIYGAFLKHLDKHSVQRGC